MITAEYDELNSILSELLPTVIEYPGYKPHTEENGIKCLSLIKNFEYKEVFTSSIDFSPERISELKHAERLKYNNVIYNPIEIVDNSNNNSLVQLLEQGDLQFSWI